MRLRLAGTPPSPWPGLRRASCRAGRPAPVLEARRRARLPGRRHRGAVRRLRGPRAPGPGRAAPARPRGALRLVARPRRARAASTPAPATRARSSASRAARARSSSTPPSSRCTPWPWATGRPPVRGHVAGRQGLRGRRAPASRRTFFDPADKYVWALAFDRPGTPAGGHGRRGQASTASTGQARPRCSSPAPEAHITALAVDAGGSVYAGSAPGGILYRIDPQGKVFVLHDSPYREVKALERGAGRQRLRRRRRRHGRKDEPAAPAPDAAARDRHAADRRREVTVTESFSGRGRARRPSAAASRRDRRSRRAAGRAEGRRAAPARLPARWTRSGRSQRRDAARPRRDRRRRAGGHRQQGPALPHPRRPLLDDDRVLPRRAGHDASCARETGDVYLATSNPGRVHALERGAGARGHLHLQGEGHRDRLHLGPRCAGTRSVPAGTRDRGADAAAATRARPTHLDRRGRRPTRAPQGEPVASERARFLQVQGDPRRQQAPPRPCSTPLAAAYLQRNLRPQIQTDHRPSAGRGLPEADLAHRATSRSSGLDEPRCPDGRAPRRPRGPSCRPPPAYSRKLYQKGMQTFSWKADDPNGDTLAYDVHYRPRRRRRASASLRRGRHRAVLAWDTTTVPNGRYVVRVTASDAPGNPEALVPQRRQGERALRRRQHAARGDGAALTGGRPPRARRGQGRQQPGAPDRVLDRRRALAGGPSHRRHQRQRRGDATSSARAS